MLSWCPVCYILLILGVDRVGIKLSVDGVPCALVGETVAGTMAGDEVAFSTWQ